MAGEQIQMLDQRLHGRIEAIALLELYGKTFREIAGANTRRIEALKDRQHCFDLSTRGAELLRHRPNITAEVAGVVHEIDQVLADHAPHRIGHGKRELFGQMIGKRCFGRNESLQIVAVNVVACLTNAAPFEGPAQILATRERRPPASARGTSRLSGPLGAASRAPKIASCGHPLRLASPGRLGPRLAHWQAPGAGCVRALLDIGNQIEVGELQQLDGLHQLRRHHQGMALADF